MLAGVLKASPVLDNQPEFQGPQPAIVVEVSLVATFCLWRLVVYTEHDFPLILGFKLSTQTLVFTLDRNSRKETETETETMVFTLNLISQKSYLHSQIL